jgi:hypothetical protein
MEEAFDNDVVDNGVDDDVEEVVEEIVSGDGAEGAPLHVSLKGVFTSKQSLMAAVLESDLTHAGSVLVGESKKRKYCLVCSSSAAAQTKTRKRLVAAVENADGNKLQTAKDALAKHDSLAQVDCKWRIRAVFDGQHWFISSYFVVHGCGSSATPERISRKRGVGASIAVASLSNKKVTMPETSARNLAKFAGANTSHMVSECEVLINILILIRIRYLLQVLLVGKSPPHQYLFLISSCYRLFSRSGRKLIHRGFMFMKQPIQHMLKSASTVLFASMDLLLSPVSTSLVLYCIKMMRVTLLVRFLSLAGYLQLCAQMITV